MNVMNNIMNIVMNVMNTYEQCYEQRYECYEHLYEQHYAHCYDHHYERYECYEHRYECYKQRYESCSEGSSVRSLRWLQQVLIDASLISQFWWNQNSAAGEQIRGRKKHFNYNESCRAKN